MKLHHTLALAALAIAGAANAATYDLGTLGPVDSVKTLAGGAGTVDDIFTFTLAAPSDVAIGAQDLEFTGAPWKLDGGSVSLFTSGGTLVQSAFTFDGSLTETDYSGLLAGNYYFEVTGSAAVAYAYGVYASADNSNPASNVPEPADAALLIAGLGMLAFVGGRRRQQ